MKFKRIIKLLFITLMIIVNAIIFTFNDNIINITKIAFTSNKFETVSPTLTAVSNPETNQIELSWSMGGVENELNHYYKIYQKKPGDDVFQTISTTDFTKEDAEINVLNVYPDTGNNLKTWMETNGYGMGIIKVTPVSISAFNANPSGYMKDENGEWIYDVIMFGSWDCNNGRDITYDASLLVEQFIKNGKGAVFGHDTIAMVPNASTSLYHPNFSRLASYVNVVNRGSWTNNNSTQVYLSKDGVFTQYPWYIGKAGTILTIPAAHTLDQTANGDIWLKFNNNVVAGNYNHYLTTWNNCALIQTGHSNGAATADEQKILANVMFYVNQLTSETSIDDYSGRDYAVPDNVENVKYEFDNKGGFSYTYDESKDNGSEYSHYIQAIAKDDNTTANSNIVTTTITTGLQGYSYIVDNSSTTVPDDVVDTTDTTINVDSSSINWSLPVYMHIKAIDNAGNMSEVTHTLIDDSILPEIIVEPSTTEFTNEDVELDVTVRDLESGVKNIQLPNGTNTTQLNNKYVVTENGAYNFVATDNAGNVNTKIVNVNNIDKIAPKLELTYETSTGWINKDLVVDVKLTDEGVSGVKNIKLPDGSFVEGGEATFIIRKIGTYEFYGYDKAGNEVKETLIIENVDSIAPEIELSLSNKEWTSSDIDIIWEIIDEGGSELKQIKLPDGSSPLETSGRYRVSKNGEYKFIAYDNAGNIKETIIIVANIDKDNPQIEITQEITEWTNENYILKVESSDLTSGIKRIELPNGKFSEENYIEYEISSNGTYKFIVYDYANNKTEKEIIIENIDKTPPELILNVKNEDITSRDVIVEWQTRDTQSGYRNFVLSNGNIITDSNGEVVIKRNGIYTFLSYDNLGNVKKETLHIRNIEKTAPTLKIEGEFEEYTKENIQIKIYAQDNKTLEKEIVLPNGETSTENELIYEITENEKYYFKVHDNLGNIYIEELEITNIDKEGPKIELKIENINIGPGKIISWEVVDEKSGFKEIVLPNGTKSNANKGKIYVEKIEEVTFTAYDRLGNSNEEIIKIDIFE